MPISVGLKDEHGEWIEIPICRVTEYVNDEFYEALDFYKDCRLFMDLGNGLPLPGGWANQPFRVYRILKLFLAEEARWERLEQERHKKELKNGHGKGNS